MSTIKNKIILITGGVSGIGKLMCRMVLEKGASTLVIWDINPMALAETVLEMKQLRESVYGYVVDVSNVEEIINAAASVRLEVGPIDILINNAGIVVGKSFSEHSHSEIKSSMSINSNALMHIAKEFLPQMIERRSGHICNIASAAGMVSNPRMSVYCASKWAVIGWSDSLRLEMEQEKTGVQITTIIPYYISTGMFTGVRSRIPVMKPENAAKRIINAIENNRIFFKMPWIINLLPLAKGILPIRAFDLFVGKGFGVYKSMHSFKGRS